MHTSSCDRLRAWHQWRCACDGSHERYWEMLATVLQQDVVRGRYPMLAFGEDQCWISKVSKNGSDGRRASGRCDLAIRIEAIVSTVCVLLLYCLYRNSLSLISKNFGAASSAEIADVDQSLNSNAQIVSSSTSVYEHSR